MADDYILQEDTFKIGLEDSSGFIEAETATPPVENPIPPIHMARERV